MKEEKGLAYKLGDLKQGNEQCMQCIEKNIECHPWSDSATCHACKMVRQCCSWLGNMGSGRKRGVNDNGEEEFRHGVYERLDHLQGTFGRIERMLEQLEQAYMDSLRASKEVVAMEDDNDEGERRRKVKEGKQKQK